MADDFELTPPDSKKKEHGPSKPTPRSLEHLRKNGWTCHIVEKWIPPRGEMPYGRRIDCFGFGDILAMRPTLYVDADGFMTVEPIDKPKKIIPGVIALIQTTTGHGGSMAEHRDNILRETVTDKDGNTKPNEVRAKFLTWKSAGGKVFLHGWRYGGARGERKGWILREEEL